MTNDPEAVDRIEAEIRARVPPTPAGLRHTIVTRLEDRPAGRSGSVARWQAADVTAAGSRLPTVLAASALLAAGIVVAARLARAAALGTRLRGAVRRAVPAPRSGAGAASR